MAENASGAPTRPSLLLRVRNPQDAPAWQTFVEVYGPFLFRYCRSRGLKREDAENVTQEVFVRVLQAIRAFDYQPDRGRFRDWLGTLTRNEINRFLKKEMKARRVDGDPLQREALDLATARAEDTTWSEAFNAHLLQIALDRARPHFQDKTWRAFELVWLAQHPVDQIAAELQITKEQVYVAKKRVLDRLEQEVLELADDTVLFAR